MSLTLRRTAAGAAVLCLLAPAGAAAQEPRTTQDLRGEQARAAADLVLGARDTSVAQAPAAPAQPPAGRLVEVPERGFDVTDAAVGGAAALGLVALAGGGALLTTRRRDAVAGHEG